MAKSVNKTEINAKSFLEYISFSNILLNIFNLLIIKKNTTNKLAFSIKNIKYCVLKTPPSFSL